MTAGSRIAQVTIQRQTRGTDEYGEALETWTDLAEEWAKVFYGRGSERRQAAMEQGQQSATFQVLDNERTRTVTLLDRLVVGGFIWDINGAAPDVPRPGSIELTATATNERWTPPGG